MLQIAFWVFLEPETDNVVRDVSRDLPLIQDLKLIRDVQIALIDLKRRVKPILLDGNRFRLRVDGKLSWRSKSVPDKLTRPVKQKAQANDGAAATWRCLESWFALVE